MAKAEAEKAKIEAQEIMDFMRSKGYDIPLPLMARIALDLSEALNK